MNALLHKEFRLTIHPLFLLTPLLGAMVMIPDWPYFIALMYFFIAVPTLVAVSRDQRDLDFMQIMPVPRGQAVSARILAVTALELLYVLVTMAFATLNLALFGEGPFLEPNLAFFGLGLAMYGIYNVVFFALHYRTGRAIVLPTVAATAAAIVFAVVVEVANALVQGVNDALDGTAPTLAHALVFIAGAGAFAYLVRMAQRVSSARFAHVDL